MSSADERKLMNIGVNYCLCAVYVAAAAAAVACKWCPRSREEAHVYMRV